MATFTGLIGTPNSVIGLFQVDDAGSTSATAFSGSASLSGSGTLTLAGTPAISGAAGLSGSGTLSLTGTPAITTATGSLSGSGTLVNTVSGLSIKGAVNLSGSGTLVTTGTGLTASGAATLSGSGTLTGTQTSITASGTTSLSGSGTLTGTQTAVTVSGATSLSGSGTLTGTQTSITVSGASALSGSGTLTLAGKPAIPGSGTFSGSGTLVNTVAGLNITQTANLSGSGTLTGAQQSIVVIGATALSGSGTLSFTTTLTASGSTSLSGSGTLSFVAGPGFADTSTLSGSGTLTVAQTSITTSAWAVNRTNLIPNPSAEVNVTGASTFAATITRSTTWSTDGAASFLITPNGVSSDTPLIMGGDTGAIRLGMLPGHTYTASATVNTPVLQTGTLNGNGARQITVFVRDPSAGGGYKTFKSAQGPTTGTARLSVTFTVPNNATEAFVRFYNGADNSSANLVYWDALLLEEKPSLGAYFSGDTASTTSDVYSWTGTANNSTSNDASLGVPLSSTGNLTLGLLPNLLGTETLSGSGTLTIAGSPSFAATVNLSSTGGLIAQSIGSLPVFTEDWQNGQASGNATTSATLGTNNGNRLPDGHSIDAGGSTWTYSNATPFRSSLPSYSVLRTASSGTVFHYYNYLLPTTPEAAAVQMYISPVGVSGSSTWPPVGLWYPMLFRTAANGAMGGIFINTAGKLAIVGTTGGVAVVTGTVVLAVDTIYRIEVVITDTGTTTGTMNVNLYLGDSLTPIDTLSTTTANFGGAPIGQVRIGCVSGSSCVGTAIRFGSYAIAPGAVSPIGDYFTRSWSRGSVAVNNATTFNPATMTTQGQDLMVAFVAIEEQNAVNQPPSPSTPSGWTLQQSINNGTDSFLGVYTKVAGGSIGAATTDTSFAWPLNNSGTAKSATRIFGYAIANADVVRIVDGTVPAANSGTGAVQQAPGMNALVGNGSMLLQSWVAYQATNLVSGAFTVPPALTSDGNTGAAGTINAGLTMLNASTGLVFPGLPPVQVAVGPSPTNPWQSLSLIVASSDYVCSLSGSGSLTLAGSPSTSGATSLSGSGTLSATETGMSISSATVSLSGSGGLVVLQPLASFSGSGTLTLTGTPAITSASGALSGSGTLTAVGVPTASGADALSGSGTLTLVGHPATSGASSLSGSGTLSFTATPAIPGADGLSGSGTLSLLAGSISASGADSLSGAGTLAFTTTLSASGAATLSGSGTLTATGKPTASGVETLSGSGTLVATGTPAIPGATALSGSGTLSFITTPIIPGATVFSGSGTLSLAGTPKPSGVDTLSGSGTLSMTGKPGASGTDTLSGSGTLTSTGKPGVTILASFSGSGTLGGAGTPKVLAAATLSGTGLLNTSGVISEFTAAALAGLGTLSTLGSPNLLQPAWLSGSGSLTLFGTRRHHFQAYIWEETAWIPTDYRLWHGSWVEPVEWAF